MMFRLSLLSMLFAGAAAGSRVINQSNGEIRADSDVGRHLLQHARSLENNQNNNFLAGYSLKFQGCHHVQQWNNDADGEDDVRIKTKRLVRFRLCPADSCSSTTSGCTSYYGDYIVDMTTFVEAYLNAKEEEGASLCQQARNECQNLCGDDSDCQSTCLTDLAFPECYYYNNNGNNNNNNNNQDGGFDVMEYAECARYDFGGRRLEQNYNNYQDVEYYLGPYCADQGGEIHMGLFTDDTCSTFAQNGETMFYNANGYELPYSDNSLVTSMCLGCAGYNENGEYEMSELCQEVYETSGKCEDKMSISYPSSSSCDYIEGIKIIREDGVIRSSSTRKSKAAAVSIGFFLTIAVLLGAYVYYLQTKLSRARVNLAAASHSLT